MSPQHPGFLQQVKRMPRFHCLVTFEKKYCPEMHRVLKMDWIHMQSSCATYSQMLLGFRSYVLPFVSIWLDAQWVLLSVYNIIPIRAIHMVLLNFM